jgi:hypothetical protein
MSSITLAEIKTILQLDDTIIDKESVTIDTNKFHRLDHKPVKSIYRVDTDTQWSTGSHYTTADYYTTKDYSGYTMLRRISTGTIGTTETIYASYSYNEYDDRINALLPQVEYDVCDYLNNWFIDEQTEYPSGDFKLIARAGSSHPCITDTVNAKFIVYGFQTGMDITLTNTKRNAGIYHISSAAASKIKLSSGDTLLQECSTDQYGERVIQLNRIKWPPALKRIIAQLIWININRVKDSDIQSKSLGPSSVTYASVSEGGYSPALMEALNKFKNAKVK